MKKLASRGEEIYSSDVFQILLDYEVSRTRRYPAPLALLHIEVEPVTMNKDTLSSASSVFTNALNAHLRSVDIPSTTKNGYRILLPTTEEAGTRSICERLLAVFRNKFDTKEGSSIAFSLQIGATTHPGGKSISSDILFEKAEEALKQSKSKGANTYALISGN